ncbi:peptidylprolyl isomerase [Saccharibacillus sp. JS10]|uniref:peptidylprolyl isomerase n=1 Tax=Saccharibacillus sp. JS10 TaxID=2950552 RepID=UPI00210A9059|nr:peptidylprolyl isomerase [Saccharibacillus sp. JS10]MCQ4088959.1 peptidylprolyl isomerase [Saccharibacillus sp. JS10]
MMQLSHKKWGKLASLGAVAVLSFSVLAACGDKADNDTAKTDDSKVLATYDGGTVTEDQFNTELNVMKFLQPTYASMMDSSEIKNYMLDQQIAYNYLEGKATDEEKKKGAEMATEQINQLKGQVDQEQLDTMLKDQNITEADLTTYMTQVMTAVQYMSDQVKDEDVQKEYDANKDAYITAKISHILIGLTDKDGKERTDAQAKKLADEVKAKLDKGEDFAKLAKEYSDDGSGANGGLLAEEEAPVNGYVEEFKQASIDQKVGEIGDPVKTQFGYHIIRVESRTDTLTDKVKDEVRRTLASTKLNEFMEKELEGITKSKEEFKDEQPAATEEGTDSAPATGTDGAVTEGADQGAATEQGTSTDKSGEAGTSTETNTDGK